MDRLQIFTDGALVFERSAKGAAPDLGTLLQAQSAPGATQLSWSSSEGMRELAYRVLYTTDGGGASWQVLAVSAAQPGLTLPVDLLQVATHPLLLVRTAEQVYEIDAL